MAQVGPDGRRRSVVTLMVVAAGSVMLLGSPAARAEAAPPNPTTASPAKTAGPSLSIAVDDGHNSATVGDRLSYTVTVRNLGGAVERLLITQTMPTGLEFGTADKSGIARSGKVSWRADLAAGTSTTFHSTMTVTATPADLLRLASVACAGTGPDAPPIVCAAHSDALPAAALVAEAKSAPAAVDRIRWWYVGGGLLVVLLGISFPLMRRRLRGRPAGTP